MVTEFSRFGKKGNRMINGSLQDHYFFLSIHGNSEIGSKPIFKPIKDYNPKRAASESGMKYEQLLFVLSSNTTLESVCVYVFLRTFRLKVNL